MAITWDVKITPIDIPNKIVSIRATRTDDDLTNPDPTYTVGMDSADISTQAKKNEALDILWAKYQTKAAKQTQTDTVIGNLEAVAKTNLEARET